MALVLVLRCFLFSDSAISLRFLKFLTENSRWFEFPRCFYARKMFVGWLTVRGRRLLIVVVLLEVFISYLGSIPNGAGTMGLRCFLFSKMAGSPDTASMSWPPNTMLCRGSFHQILRSLMPFYYRLA